MVTSALIQTILILSGQVEILGARAISFVVKVLTSKITNNDGVRIIGSIFARLFLVKHANQI